MVKFKAPTVELPEDISILQAMILQLLSDVNEKNRQIDDLQNQLEWFKRHIFGRRSEKLSPNQLTLFQGMTADQEASSEEWIQKPADISGRSYLYCSSFRLLLCF